MGWILQTPSGRGHGMSRAHMRTLRAVEGVAAVPCLPPAASGPGAQWPLCTAPAGRISSPQGSACPSSHLLQSFRGLALLKTLLVNPNESLISLIDRSFHHPLLQLACPALACPTSGLDWPQTVHKGGRKEGMSQRLSLYSCPTREALESWFHSCTLQRNISQFTSLFFHFPTSGMFGWCWPYKTDTNVPLKEHTAFSSTWTLDILIQESEDWTQHWPSTL